MALFNSIDMSVGTVSPTTFTFTTNQNVIIGAYIANTHTESIEVDVLLRGKYLAKSIEIPFKSSLSILDGKIVANTTDVLSVQVTSPSGTADVIFSILEDAIATV